ncbi:MAG: adenylyltransferase/cytidyltransferase family protein [Candidatus Levybacteria bacterium]|nr:adenylyltransferase/cytidyltransferase family protein [Candidatus Levybacteria bacterium]
MEKILNIKDAIKISKKLRNQNKTIVLVGGFFDILHVGHITFLEKAKQLGDYLFVLLEEDERSRKIKGKNRPINSQTERAIILSAIQSVNFVILLKKMTSNEIYDRIIVQISPNVIATTYPDPKVVHKIRQAKLINGKVEYVIKRINKYSSTRLANLIAEKRL